VFTAIKLTLLAQEPPPQNGYAWGGASENATRFSSENYYGKFNLMALQ